MQSWPAFVENQGFLEAEPGRKDGPGTFSLKRIDSTGLGLAER